MDQNLLPCIHTRNTPLYTYTSGKKGQNNLENTVALVGMNSTGL